jgi:hypothetical protein
MSLEIRMQFLPLLVSCDRDCQAAQPAQQQNMKESYRRRTPSLIRKGTGRAWLRSSRMIARFDSQSEIRDERSRIEHISPQRPSPQIATLEIDPRISSSRRHLLLGLNHVVVETCTARGLSLPHIGRSRDSDSPVISAGTHSSRISSSFVSCLVLSSLSALNRSPSRMLFAIYSCKSSHRR